MTSTRATTGTSLRSSAIILGIGAALWLPSDLLLGIDIFQSNKVATHYRHLADHVAAWRIGTIGMTISALLVATAVVLVARQLATTQRRVAGVALVAISLFALTWIVEAVVRLTYTVSTARDVSAGQAVPSGFPDTWGIETSPVNIVIGALLLVGLVAFVTGVRRAGYVHRYVGWACTVTALTAMSTEPGLPFVLSVLPLTVAMLIRARGSRQVVEQIETVGSSRAWGTRPA